MSGAPRWYSAPESLIAGYRKVHNLRKLPLSKSHQFWTVSIVDHVFNDKVLLISFFPPGKKRKPLKNVTNILNLFEKKNDKN